jgi:hypothetical protein
MLELDGKFPAVVFDVRNLDNAVTHVLMHSQQPLVKYASPATRVYIQDGIFNKFAQCCEYAALRLLFAGSHPLVGDKCIQSNLTNQTC